MAPSSIRRRMFSSDVRGLTILKSLPAVPKLADYTLYPIGMPRLVRSLQPSGVGARAYAMD